ncbi:DUF2442 domain-containing protein [Bythopirellula polymerisocia]|uniref:DUF2442 domain-containing protein n=1 Tax=Bythopirellula polymerisocia TaxID=2528003 RepID=A0A5C6CXG4_9BACT|nr:DUF2442 domain-containing protein [Bythopirellula polymerisocia]TWU28227.1 hypothetical protein Pla144_15140 [Bythopirellula polymerisocia]
MPSLVAVSALPSYYLQVSYEDGTTGKVNLSHLVGQGVFSAWQDVSFFNQVKVGEFGELTWGQGIDLCPDALYLQLTGKSPEEVFPGSSLNSHA